MQNMTWFFFSLYWRVNSYSRAEIKLFQVQFPLISFVYAFITRKKEYKFCPSILQVPRRQLCLCFRFTYKLCYLVFKHVRDCQWS